VNGRPARERGDGGARSRLIVRDAGQLSETRDAVVAMAADAGVDGDRAARLAVAVSEIVTNALVHADGRAIVEVRVGQDWLDVEIADHGPGLPAGADATLPDPHQVHGRGLWLADQLCDRVERVSTAAGTTVTLSMRR